MILGITCVIAAAIGTFIGALFFYHYFEFINKRRSKK